MPGHFDWDAANTEHLSLHRVAQIEAEQAISDDRALFPELQDEGEEERYKLVGMTLTGRILVVVFAVRGAMMRPITAYDAPTRLQARYLRRQ